MIFWVAMVILFVGLMMTSQAFGAGRSEELQKHNELGRKGVLGNIVKLLLAGLALTGIGFGIMALGGA